MKIGPQGFVLIALLLVVAFIAGVLVGVLMDLPLIPDNSIEIIVPPNKVYI